LATAGDELTPLPVVALHNDEHELLVYHIRKFPTARDPHELVR
jgi:hypothetical protein